MSSTVIRRRIFSYDRTFHSAYKIALMEIPTPARPGDRHIHSVSSALSTVRIVRMLYLVVMRSLIVYLAWVPHIKYRDMYGLANGLIYDV